MTEKRQLLIFLIVGVLLVFGIYVAYLGTVAYSWSAYNNPMPLPDPATWPAPIQDLSAAMKEAGFDVSEMEVYRLDRLPDERAVIRLPDSDATLDFLTQQLELTPLETLDQGMRKIITRLPDEWWTDKDRAGPFLASPRFLTGEEADQYVVARDEDRKQIFIFYYFNF